jgi:von Willebrand factor type D domain
MASLPRQPPEAAMRKIPGQVAIAMVCAGLIAVAWVAASPASASPPMGQAATVPVAPTPLALAVTPSKATYPSGQAVKLDVLVTNQTGAACGLTASASGLQVRTASVDGEPITPRFTRGLLVDGVRPVLQRRLSSVASGASVPFSVEAGSPPALAMLTALPDGSALTTVWPLEAPGHYSLHLIYQVPQLAGEKSCVGLTNEALVAFTIGAPPERPAWQRYALYGAAGVVGLLILIVLVSLIRGGRRRGAAAAALLVLAVVSGIAWRPEPAAARIFFNAGNDPVLSPPIYKAYNDCMAMIAGFDPALVTALQDPDIEVFIGPWAWTQREDLYKGKKSNKHDSLVRWDWTDSSAIPGDPGVNYDPCASLYHELVHAYDAAFGDLSQQMCDATGILYDEVRATLRENQYRAKYANKGLKQRTTYDGKKLPPSEDACTTPKTAPGQRFAGDPGPTCRGVNGGCGSSNGDPHVLTFDGYFYDLQAVGEFLAVKSTVGDASTSDLMVQVRQKAFLGSRLVSVNSAVAVRVGATKLGFYLTDAGVAVHRNGAPMTVPVGDTALPGGKLTRRQDQVRGDAYVLSWPDQTQLWVEQIGSWGLHVTVAPAPARVGKLAGLLGNFDNDPRNDLATSTGTAVTQPPPFDQLYHAYGESWRVTDATSLFDYESGQTTATFTDRSFPDHPTSTSDLSTDAQDAARAACQQLGVSNPTLLDSCVLDLALTGQAAFALSASDIQVTVPSGANVDGPAVSVAVDRPGGTARVIFPGTAGQRVYVQVLSSTLPDQCGVIVLLDPDGKPLASGCIIGHTGQIDGTVLAASGAHTVVIDPTGDAVGQVKLRIVSTLDQSASIVVDGPEVTASIALSGGIVSLSFTATAGQKVFVDAASSTLPDQCGVLTLRRPDGVGIGSGCIIGGKGFIDTIALPAPGQYSILLDPAGPATGQTKLRLRSVTDQPGSIAVNGPAVTATVAGPGGVSRLNFAGTAGQRVFVDVSAATVPDQCGVVTLRGPDNTGIASGCIIGGVGFVDATTLPTTGAYTIVLDPEARNVGTAQIRLNSVTDQQAAIALNGSSVTATVTTPGGESRLTFSATAGQTVFVDVTSATVDDACGIISLLDTKGAMLASGCIITGKGSIPGTTVPTTGQYTILLNPAERRTGHATIRVHT